MELIQGATEYVLPLPLFRRQVCLHGSHCKQQHKNMQSEGLRLFVENKSKINMTLCLISF